MRPAKYHKNKTPVFIAKLYEILQDSRNNSVIEWTPDNNGFAILDLNNFTTQILPQYFKHSNYNSFIRQLNMYRFNKVRQDGLNGETQHVYHNNLFLKDNKSGLKEIKRKQTAVKTQSLVPFNDDAMEGWDLQDRQEQNLGDRLSEIKEKQEELDSICCSLLSQNQILLKQNRQLVKKIRTQSKKKDRVIKQVFRIVGASITEFWDDFCESNDSVEQKQKSLEDLYEVFIQFLDQYELPQIFQILDYFIGTDHSKKAKIFKIIKENQSPFLQSYSEEEIRQFISETTLLLNKQKS